MYEHNALGYRSGLALCLTKARSSRARCPATALIFSERYRIANRKLSIHVSRLPNLYMYSACYQKVIYTSLNVPRCEIRLVP